MDKKTTRFIFLCITYALLLAFALYNIRAIATGGVFVWNVFFPLVLGGCIAFMLSIPMNGIEHLYGKLIKNKNLHKLKRPLSLLMTLLLLIVLLFLIIFSIVPELGRTFGKITEQFPMFIDDLNRWIQAQHIPWENVQSFIDNLELDWEKIKNNSFDYIKQWSGTIFSSTLGAAKSVFSSMTSFLLGLIFAIYILLSKEKLGNQLIRLLYAILPEKRVEDLKYIARLSHKTFASFLSSQCLEALILGTMFFVSMRVLKMPYALLIGMVISVTALVPIVGSFIGMVFGTFLILMVNPMQALWFIILFLVLQQIEGNFIYPFVVGSSVGLPSIWVLLAVLVGAGLMGIIGMIIFIPLFSVGYVLLGEFIDKRLKERQIDQPKMK